MPDKFRTSGPAGLPRPDDSRGDRTYSRPRRIKPQAGEYDEDDDRADSVPPVDSMLSAFRGSRWYKRPH